MRSVETVCTALIVCVGIPRSFLLSNRGGNTGATAVAQQSNSIVSSTIQWWRVVLGRLLTVVYHQVCIQNLFMRAYHEHRFMEQRMHRVLSSSLDVKENSTLLTHLKR